MIKRCCYIAILVVLCVATPYAGDPSVVVTMPGSTGDLDPSCYVTAGYPEDPMPDPDKYSSMCLETKDGSVKGIGTSRIITQKSDKRQWIMVYTPSGTKTAWVDDIQGASCSEIIQTFSEKQKAAISAWLDGGVNPMLTEQF